MDFYNKNWSVLKQYELGWKKGLIFLMSGCAKGGGRKKRKRKRGREKKGRKKRRL